MKTRQKYLIGAGVVGALVLVVLVVLITLAIVNGGTNKSGSGGGGNQTPPSSPSPKKSQDSSNKEAAVGDTVNLSDSTLRVNEAEPNYVPSNRFSRPQSGNEYVRVNVTITNTSNGQVNFNPLDFKLQDADGVQRNRSSVSQMPNPLEYGSLAPNGSVTGNMVFEAPQGATGLKLIYKPNAFNNEQVTIDL